MEWSQWLIAISTTIIAAAVVTLTVYSIRFFVLINLLIKSSSSLVDEGKQNLHNFGSFLKGITPVVSKTRQALTENPEHKNEEREFTQEETAPGKILRIVESAALGLALWKTLKRRR